jgi:hypothetical protein
MRTGLVRTAAGRWPWGNRSPSMVRQHPPELRCWTLTGRMVRSASLLVLSGTRHNDNNAAEREIRMGELRIKVSGCMRSMAGAEALCAIRSCLSTAARHGIGMLGALTRAASGTAWVPETA